ncbi:hypothetical protein [Thioclava sp. DLFJ4-1]|uniref:hypothetical protein n=1 Tax=Thioclava sp. DLFJ4-1 TaxID=1915313 RepID=UPI00117D2EDB|nr:hypothetical protein [Thioclava sp. DLFJ4-1]
MQSLVTLPAPSSIEDLSAEAYVDLLHPRHCHGRPSVLWFDGEESQCLCLTASDLKFGVSSLLDGRAYLSMNRFWKRGNLDQLKTLNALYVDLDWHKMAEWREQSPDEVEAAILRHVCASNLPAPSVVLQSGRGSALIWLIDEMPPQALPRWQSTMRALGDVFARFGVDRSSQEAARIFRLPGSINEKSGRRVRVSGGSAGRHDFDALSDEIFQAAGLLTRVELQVLLAEKRAKRRSNVNPREMPFGLPPAARFRQIRDDLEAIRMSHGGRLPEGLRNTWLHLYATSLTHDPRETQIAQKIEAMAQLATPDLPAQEVAAIIRSAEKQAARERGATPLKDGRYHYSGGTIAERLGISGEDARALALRQIMPAQERKRRKAEAERKRRAQNGAQTRAEYLAQNSASRREIWKEYGLSRTTYYKRKKDGTLPPLLVSQGPDRSVPATGGTIGQDNSWNSAAAHTDPSPEPTPPTPPLHENSERENLDLNGDFPLSFPTKGKCRCRNAPRPLTSTTPQPSSVPPTCFAAGKQGAMRRSGAPKKTAF